LATGGRLTWTTALKVLVRFPASVTRRRTVWSPTVAKLCGITLPTAS
jgi:hypothetical protein